jgi:hypothetical protein
MNIDLYGLFEFGDEDGVKQFVLAHRFTHEYEAQAINQQFNTSLDTYGVGGAEIVDPWIQLMRGEREDYPQEIQDWLEVHNENHQDMLAFLGGSGISTVGGTDLSIADFSDPARMYEWLTLHQQIHLFEQQALGLT